MLHVAILSQANKFKNNKKREPKMLEQKEILDNLKEIIVKRNEISNAKNVDATSRLKRDLGVKT